MRAAIYYSNKDIRIEERPRPKIGPGELLIRVRACGICGTDVLQWYRRDRVPLILGHEIAGEIEEVGRGLRQCKKGQRVSASHHVPCGKCSYCLRGHESVCDTLRRTHFDPGGFVEFLRLPRENVELGGVYPLPDNLSFDAASFTEPLACVLRGQRFAKMSAGKSVLVLGCGISGLLHIQLARAKKASFIAASDICDYRLKKAKELGADEIINAQGQDVVQRFGKLNQGKGADVVIVATGAKTAQEQALSSVERGGCVLFFAATGEGVEIPLSVNNTFWRNEVTLTSSYAAAPKEHLEAIELLGKGAIDTEKLITHRFNLDKIQEGFRLVAEARDSLKVIIEPQE